MDTFTRNYSIVLGIIVLAVAAVFLYEDPQTRELNDLLLADNRLAVYPYKFRVLALENGIATMTTPRSAEFPAYKALGLLFPDLANRPQDDPALMQGQLDMAEIQSYAQQLLIDSGRVRQVTWQLDRDWLDRNGITLFDPGM